MRAGHAHRAARCARRPPPRCRQPAARTGAVARGSAVGAPLL